MLRKSTVATSVAVLMAGTGAALAADVYDPVVSPAPYSPYSAYNWTGPYMGLVGGYGWGGSVNHDGWIAGAYGGYNFQTSPNWMFGFEGDFTFTGKSGGNSVFSVANPWNSTVRGRLGYTRDRYLFYGTAGLAIGRVEARDGTKDSATETGWTAGIGVEAALTETLTGRVEYRHTDLGKHTFSNVGAVKFSSDDLMVGVGMKF